jgi:hypothetical protein
MNFVWLPAQVLVVALASPPEVPPTIEEPAPEAAAPAIEVVRIKRDFGKPHVDMAIDAWTDDGAARLESTRLWWVDTSAGDRRKPLGRLIERLVHLQYRRLSGAAWTVVVAGDGKEFTFTVERGHDGKVHAFVPVDTDDGRHIRRCRIHGARLLARRVLGVPVGIDRIAVTCRDGAGVVNGRVRHREV